MSRSVVLGLNAFHADAAAALVVDGRVVAAAEEERFRRVKHFAGFPSEAIRWGLHDAGIDARDVTHIAINSDGRRNLGARIRYALTRWPSPKLVLGSLRTRRRRAGVQQLLEQFLPGHRFQASVVPVDHHRAHLASAYAVSGFDRALAVSVDGMGDFASAAWGVGADGRLVDRGRIAFPHSLGIFYQAMTQYLGFPNYGDEYKVMGLAPYGAPAFVDELRRVVHTGGDGRFVLDTRYFRHHRERIAGDWADGIPSFENLFTPALERLLGTARRADEPLEQRHKDIARTVQVVFEDAYLGLLQSLANDYGCTSLAIAGGCAQNSVANGHITNRTGFRDVYVAAAGYDAGGALGAACEVSSQLGSRVEPLRHALLGPRFDDGAFDAAIAREVERIAANACTVDRVDSHEADRRVVGCITNGGVVGWFQGRMEWGPRALGNRSIIADPRRTDMKDILNHKIKRRESFRPFAPSVLREHVGEWFTKDGDVPFMSMVFPIRPEKRAQIPAVTHVDGTGRLQTVDESSNARYAQLIRAFHRETGVPMVLNTSFNENEPIVCKPEEALDCFLRTKMDMLVLGDTVIERKA